MAACHACGDSYEVSGRVGLRDTCDGCGADLHVCLNCRFHDPAASNQCRETEAELIVEKNRSNRCDWFQPGEGKGAPQAGEKEARAKLGDLFRKPGAPAAGGHAKADSRAALEGLFRKKKP